MATQVKNLTGKDLYVNGVFVECCFNYMDVANAASLVWVENETLQVEPTPQIPMYFPSYENPIRLPPMQHDVNLIVHQDFADGGAYRPDVFCPSGTITETETRIDCERVVSARAVASEL